MALKTLVNGAFQDITTLKICVDGVWQEADHICKCNNGVWENVWENFNPIIYHNASTLYAQGSGDVVVATLDYDYCVKALADGYSKLKATYSASETGNTSYTYNVLFIYSPRNSIGADLSNGYTYNSMTELFQQVVEVGTSSNIQIGVRFLGSSGYVTNLKLELTQ